MLLTSGFTTIKFYAINIVKKFTRKMVNLFWSIYKLLNKLKSTAFLASSVSTYDFTTLYIAS